MKDKFYLQCTRDTVGSNASFHAIDGSGYVTDLRKAHIYTREEAQMKWEHGREIDQPLAADLVDALSVLHVDHQYIDHRKEKEDPSCKEFVIYRKNQWDGNDVPWITQSLGWTYDYSQAGIFKKKPIELSDVELLPKSFVDSIARPTFQIENINHRKMVQGAGLIIPDHIKRFRRSKASGKVRWNCPCCGKISWQYNPYDFEGCLDVYCEEWRNPYS